MQHRMSGAAATSTSDGRPGRSIRAGLSLLIGSHLVDDFYQGAVPALLPFFAAERSYTGLAAGGLTFAATFLSSTMQPAFGWASDRHRMRWLIGVGMLVAGVGVGLSGLVDNYSVTWLFVMLTGLGVAAYHPEATRSAREVGGQSAQAMSWFSVGGNIGIALAPVIVTPVLATTGLAGTPLLTIPAVLMAAVLLAASLRRRRDAAVASKDAGTPRSRHTGVADDWVRMAYLVGIVVLRSTTYLGLATFLVLYLVRHFDMAAGAAEPVLTVFTGTGACGTVFGGWLADRWGRLRTLRLGYALGTLGTAVIAFAPTVAVVYVGCVIAGVGLYLPFAIHIMLGQDYLPNRLATASGITTGLAISAGGLFSPLLGLLTDASSEKTTFEVLIVLPLLALVLSTRLHSHTGRQDVR